MNRTSIYRRTLSLLLWLLAVMGASAQSLELEYWFDKTKNIKPESITVPASGYLSMGIPANNLQTGIHTLYLRAKEGSDYSPLYSTTFFKFSATGSSTLQYWFDDNINNDNNNTNKFGTHPIDPDVETVQILDLDLKDNEMFPLGIHQLNMRIAANGGIFSPVYTALVMKMPSGTEGSVLEYWFDDDCVEPATIPVNVNYNGIQELHLDMNKIEKFPYGFHKLNMRIAANGHQYSPIYSAFVMRLHNGANSHLVYWLDDDYDPKNLKTVKASSYQGADAIFKTRLDFSTASSGMHRLHYRIAQNGVDDGPVYEVPILVTRKYNSSAWVTIVNQSHWLNDANPAIYAITNPKDVYTHSYLFDPAKYPAGQHAFHVQFQNSADVWSEENVTYFYKEAATGRLRAGHMPDQDTGIDDTTQSDDVICSYSNGTIYIDCESPRLGKTGIIMVCDMTGRVIARQNVTNTDGIHAAVSVENLASQLLIVKLVSGNVHFSQKIIKR